MIRHVIIIFILNFEIYGKHRQLIGKTRDLVVDNRSTLRVDKATQSRVKVPREPASFMDANSGPGRRVRGNCVGIRGKYDASVKT